MFPDIYAYMLCSRLTVATNAPGASAHTYVVFRGHASPLQNPRPPQVRMPACGTTMLEPSDASTGSVHILGAATVLNLTRTPPLTSTLDKI